MLPAGAGGGANLGVASGVIQLDTSQLALAVQTARSLAQSLQAAMNQAGTGTNRANTGFAQMAANLRSVNTELLAIGAGAGLLTKLGLDGAMNLRNYTIAFRQFVGSQKEAVALTNQLIDAANKYGLEWEGVAQLGRALLPSLKGGAKELDGWISRAARLRSLFPSAARGSETIAISEFLAGQTRSLSTRFNVPLNVIEDAKSKFTDLGQAFDYILERRGATEEAAVAMANAFVGVRNELTLLLAQGFTPLFQALQPVLKSFREFLTNLRETNPALTTAGAGLIAFAAAGAPALLLLNQLIIAAEKLKTLGILGGLGKAGAVGLAAGAAIGLNTVGNRVIGGLTGNKEQANTSLADSFTYFKNGLAVLTKWLIDGAMYVNQGLIKLTQSFLTAAGALNTAAGNLLRSIGSILPAGMGGQSLTQAGDFLVKTGSASDQANALLDKRLARMWAGAETMKQGVQNFFMGSGASAPADSGGGGGVAGGGGPDIAGPVRDWAKAVQRIEREAGEARLQATQDYEKQRSEAIAQYELSALRDAEDFARQRARQEANYQRQITQVQEDAAKREATWQRDLSEKLAELRSDSNERLVELDEDYAKDRERSARDHRERLLNAAARLDAIGVAEEQRRYADQSNDAEENYQEQRGKIQEALDERIADELKAHARRLEDQRTADAERLADMKRAFEEQRAETDFERALQQQRRAEDFANQLAQMDIAQAERLAQIDRQAAQEKAALDESFLEQLYSVGIYRQAWLDQQKAQQDASMRLWEAYWEDVKKRFPDAAKPGPQLPSFPTSFADYGYTSSGITSPAGQAASGGSVSSRSITIAEGAIVVNAASTQNEREVARQVRTEMERLLMEAAR